MVCTPKVRTNAMREKCPNTEFGLCFPVFQPQKLIEKIYGVNLCSQWNMGKYEP